ncbi:MAG TPA: hypothetical protein VFU74_09320 [Actinocrinis sp.]|nr:hypothetical protein [Actinocrinis sp.]
MRAAVLVTRAGRPGRRRRALLRCLGSARHRTRADREEIATRFAQIRLLLRFGGENAAAAALAAQQLSRRDAARHDDARDERVRDRRRTGSRRLRRITDQEGTQRQWPVPILRTATGLPDQWFRGFGGRLGPNRDTAAAGGPTPAILGGDECEPDRLALRIRILQQAEQPLGPLPHAQSISARGIPDRFPAIGHQRLVRAHCQQQ